MEGIVAYPWYIDTKYYTANVQICLTDNKTLGDEAFAECVQCVILQFDPSQV